MLVVCAGHLAVTDRRDKRMNGSRLFCITTIIQKNGTEKLFEIDLDGCIYSFCSRQLLGDSRIPTLIVILMAFSYVLGCNCRIFIIASLGTKMIVDSLNQDIYLENVVCVW